MLVLLRGEKVVVCSYVVVMRMSEEAGLRIRSKGTASGNESRKRKGIELFPARQDVRDLQRGSPARSQQRDGCFSASLEVLLKNNTQ